MLPALADWSHIECPMPHRVWERHLRGHPDVVYRNYIGQLMHCRCDNAAVVAIVNSGRSKAEWVMHLMRSFIQECPEAVWGRLYPIQAANAQAVLHIEKCEQVGELRHRLASQLKTL